MVIAVDTNVLVYAHRSAMPRHLEAFACLRELAESGRRWAIPWPCLHEFIGVVTNPRGFAAPSTLDETAKQIDIWRGSQGFLFLGESGDHLTFLLEMLRSSGAVGGAVHDAKVAAICLAHGVDELWSADRDFRKFPGLRVVNPLVAK